MAIEKTVFGTLPDGKIVYEFTIKNKNGVCVTVLNYGGIIRSIKTPDKQGNIADIVLGFDTLDHYIQDSHYIGAIVGRMANRIAHARFSIDGELYTLAANNGTNNHHGGIEGFNKKYWEIEPIESAAGDAILLHYISPDGEEGFPGNLHVTVQYLLSPNNKLFIDYKAKTDKKTVINLTQHSYFNLSAGTCNDILSHELLINAKTFLPVNEHQIPTGELKSVADTFFDFQTAKPIGLDINKPNNQLHIGKGFDHTWIISKNTQAVAHACTLSEPLSRRRVQIFTSEPGIQIYTGNYLNNNCIGKNGTVYNFRYGIGLETQHFPNSPNCNDFPSVLLNPDEEFHSTTIYMFDIY